MFDYENNKETRACSRLDHYKNNRKDFRVIFKKTFDVLLSRKKSKQKARAKG